MGGYDFKRVQMEIKRKTEILVETSRRFVIHQSDSPEQLTCPQCNEPMLTAEQAATLLGVSRRAVYQLIEAGSAHFAEIENGTVMICLSSLAANPDARIRLLPEAATEPDTGGKPE
jgi:excisionase family DNA binding protein